MPSVEAADWSDEVESAVLFFFFDLLLELDLVSLDAEVWSEAVVESAEAFFFFDFLVVLVVED